LFKFEVTILGCSSATPIFNRHPTSQWVHINHTHILLDCGEGTQMQIMRYGLKASKLSYIFISHLHGDHYLGLMGLLSSMNLNGRTDPLNLFAPLELEDILQQHFRVSESELKYPLHFFPVNHEPENLTDNVLVETQDFRVSKIPLKHSIACNGFLIEEKPGPQKISKETMDTYSIPYDALAGIKKGQSFIQADGTEISADRLLEPKRIPRSYAFCSDTCYLPELKGLLNHVNILYHETTFGHSFLSRAEQTYHTTAFQAAQLAKDAEVGKLLMGHFSARYKDLNPLLEEAKEIFPESYLALEGQTFSI